MKTISLFLFLIASVHCLGEYAKITEILDTNSFVLASTDTVKLSCIACPSVKDTSYKDILISRKIMNYLNDIVIGEPVLFESMDGNQGIMWVKFPLTKLNLNLEYIKQGWAKYIPDTTFSLHSSFSSANERAKKRNISIWKTTFSIKKGVKPRKFLYGSIGQFKSLMLYPHRYNYYSIGYGPQFLTPGCGYDIHFIQPDEDKVHVFFNTHHSITGKFLAADIGTVFTNYYVLYNILPYLLIYTNIKCGLIRHFYFSVDFVYMFPVRYGFGLQLFHQNLHFYTGKSFYSDEYEHFWCRLDISLEKYAIIKLQYSRQEISNFESLVFSIGYKI